MDLNPSSYWNTLFESVKPHIPTLDPDSSSSSENEEDQGIFRRPILLPQVTESELACLSLEDPELEGLISSVQTCGAEEKVCNQLCQVAEVPRDTEVQQDPPQQNLTSSNTKTDESNYTILSLTPLEHWDLDEVLHNLKMNGLNIEGNVCHGTGNVFEDGDNKRPQGNIMERLSAFCCSQSHGDIDEQGSTEILKTNDLPPSDPVKSPTISRQNSGWRKSFQRIEEELQLSCQDSPTVYIDLRCPESFNGRTKTSDSVTLESNTLNVPKKAQESNLLATKPNLTLLPKNGSLKADGELTGKSMLLRKIREANQIRIENSRKPKEPQDISVRTSRGENLQERLFRLSSPKEKSLLPRVNKESSPVKCATERTKVEDTPATQNNSSTKQRKNQSCQQRRQSLQQALQSKQHQQLLIKLKSHQPTKSVNDKQPAAERTDVLYDTEASYFPSVSTLPADIEDKECLLLTVYLSSPGLVAGNNHGKAHKLETATNKAHTFNFLMAWFLSLVGPVPQSNEDTTGLEIPFRVAGLQQLCREDGLAVHVLVVSHGENPQQGMNPQQSRKRNTEKSRSTFHQRVSRFLSQTSFSMAAHWLPELRTLLDLQDYPSAILLPSTCLNSFISINSDKTVMERTFCFSPGFYWQTVETLDPVCQRAETVHTQQLDTEVVIALGFKAMFLQPLVTHHILQLLLDTGLDVCGLRLLYPTPGLPTHSAWDVQNEQGDDGTCQPVLAVAVRGRHSRAVWEDLMGPSDPLLAKSTDPLSINATHCCSKKQPLVYSPRMSSRVHRELCLWFSGRAHDANDSVGAPSHNIGPGDEMGGDPSYLKRSPATLCATVKADVFLVLPPAVAPRCYSHVLAVCAHRGFSLKGIQRLQLHSKRAQAFGLGGQQVSVFCSPPVVTLDEETLELPPHCLVLLLRRENALRHCASLSAALLKEMRKKGLLGHIGSRLPEDGKDLIGCCFHIIPYSDGLLNSFGGHMWAVPDPSSAVLSSQRCSSNHELEQLVVLCLGVQDMDQGLRFLHRVLIGDPAGDGQDGFELLALKWLPTLSRLQAREVSPYEVGDKDWRGSLTVLASSPALVCVLRRVGAFATMQSLLPKEYPGNLNVLMSPTPELAYRQASLFFSEEELIPDHTARPLMKFLPRPSTTGCQSDSLYKYMLEGPQPLFTLCLFKPGVWSHALGKILIKVHQEGFTVVGLCVVVLDKTQAVSLVSAEKDPTHVAAYMEYLCSGPSLALCLQRVNAVSKLLDLLGHDDQAQDQASAQGQHLWRVCYSMDPLHSGIYGSGSYQRAVQDVKMMFPKGLCCKETYTTGQEQIHSMLSDPLACPAREKSHGLAKKETSIASLLEAGLNGGSFIRSALCQTTCLLMPSNVLQLTELPNHLDLLEKLLGTGCHLVGGRMSVLDEAQRQHITETLALPSKNNGTGIHLCEGPCLIVALQRDNVLSCFDLILESIYRMRPGLEKVGKMIISPSTDKQAVNLLCYLFDVLAPDSHHTIVPM